MAEITKDFAARALATAEPQRQFWCNDGSTISSMQELASALQRMKPETYKYHANTDKNDFSTWVADVFGDAELAGQLRNSKDKKSAAKRISARVAYLKGLLD